MKNKILISKDAQLASFYPPYLNSYYNTPNINELASKGTVFKNHFTAAPSTAMSFTSMFTSKYGFQTDRKKYVEVEEYKGRTLFDALSDRGYECHIIWDKSYIYLAQKFSKCYGSKSIFHNTDFLTHSQPPHTKGLFDNLTYNPSLEIDCKIKFEELLKKITSMNKSIFIWVHFPHVLSGRNAYGSDIDLFDEMIGIVRKYFDDDTIYITADHGHMNGNKGKYGYGFDLYDSAIRIPLITPRINDKKSIDFNTSNTQLCDIILDQKVEQKDFLVSETAYYMQPHRKMAIIKDNYKYIYEKKTKAEYLYDINWDPLENNNLLATEIYDVDRKSHFSANQRFFYPYWEKAADYGAMLRIIKNSIWKNAPWYIEIKEGIIFRLKMIYQKIGIKTKK